MLAPDSDPVVSLAAPGPSFPLRSPSDKDPYGSKIGGTPVRARRRCGCPFLALKLAVALAGVVQCGRRAVSASKVSHMLTGTVLAGTGGEKALCLGACSLCQPCTAARRCMPPTPTPAPSSSSHVPALIASSSRPGKRRLSRLVEDCALGLILLVVRPPSLSTSPVVQLAVFPLPCCPRSRARSSDSAGSPLRLGCGRRREG